MRTRPRWYRFAWFLGPPPELTERQWRVLGLVSIVSFFEMYDLYLFQLNLTQIQASLGIAEADLGEVGSIVRAGALFAVLVTALADRVGRRRMLLVTVLLYTLLTGATAFAPDATTFTALQFFARMFAVAETLLAAVVIAEEFPDAHRGWGIGALFAIQACGAGTAALLYGFVDILPGGWRALYLVGVIPLLLVARWRLALPETALFMAHQRSVSGHGARTASSLWGHDFGILFREYRQQSLAVALVTFIYAFAFGAVGFFQVKYLQDVHGLAPPAVAAMTVIGGALAIVANPLAGRLSDRLGRKRLAATFMALAGVAAMAFYGGTLPWIIPVWVLLLFITFGADTTLATYVTEAFPTGLRSTVSGLRGFIATLGGIAGLASLSWIYPWFGSNWAALQWLPLLSLAAAMVAWLAFRETAGQPLDQVRDSASARR